MNPASPPAPAAAPAAPAPTRFQLEPADRGQTLAAALRRRLSVPWSVARQLCERGKVFLDGRRELDAAARVTGAERVDIRQAAPAPLPAAQERAAAAVVYEDSQVVVIDKPVGMSSVPYERGETDTAMDLVRDGWRARGQKGTAVPLHIVHRIDKETSGLLMFAKTRVAERALQGQLRQHDVDRLYLCVAHGRVLDQTFESWLVEDRGDGLRGAGKYEGYGKRAVTHVRTLEVLRGATLLEVRLETGKTHQIRIHLSEAGHPLVGEKVYIRDYVRREAQVLDSPRLLLHAATLGFVHPVSGEKIALRRDPPPDFLRQLERLRHS